MDAIRILSFVSFGAWWAFIIVWALQWRGNKESVLKQSRRERRAYTLPFAAGVILLSSAPGLFGGPLARLAMPLVQRSLGAAAASAIASLAGLALALWARRTLGRNWSAEVTVKQGHELVSHGPYAHIRHPIYTAIFLLFLGLFLLRPTPSAVLGMVLIVAGFWVKLRQEEALMLQQFPDAYPAYMARTKRLLPFLL